MFWTFSEHVKWASVQGVLSGNKLFCILCFTTGDATGTVAKSVVPYCTAAMSLGSIPCGGNCTNQFYINDAIERPFFKIIFRPSKLPKLYLHMGQNAAKHNYFPNYYCIYFSKSFQNLTFLWGRNIYNCHL